jgi:hypothetical protein
MNPFINFTQLRETLQYYASNLFNKFKDIQTHILHNILQNQAIYLNLYVAFLAICFYKKFLSKYF